MARRGEYGLKVTEYKSEPCPICGHKGWCGWREDGLILCKRPPSPPEVAGYVYKGLARDGTTALYTEAVSRRLEASWQRPVPIAYPP